MMVDTQDIIRANLARLRNLYQAEKFGPLTVWGVDDRQRLEAEILDYINRNPREALHKIAGMVRK